MKFLNIREFPTSGSKIIDIIPPDGRGIVYLDERRGRWLLIRYERAEGWVDMRYLIPEVPPITRGRRLD